MKKKAAVLLTVCLLGCISPRQVLAENSIQPDSSGRQIAAETEELTLSTIPGTEELYLSQRKTQAEYSTTVSAEELGDAKGPIRLKLLSLVTGAYYDLELKKETEFYTASEEMAKGRKVEQMDGGLRITYAMDNGLGFAVEAVLEDDMLKLRIPIDRMEETERFVFTQLALAPNLLSAGTDQEGYLLIPDGCGALMNFNNGRSGVYDAPVYGSNKAFLYEAYAVAREDIHLPVFGIYRDGQSALAIINSGAPQARIRAATNGNETIRNRVYPVFQLREQDEQHIAEDVFQTVIQKDDGIMSDLEVTFLFGKEGGGYSEMASMLREYLRSRGMETADAAGTSVMLSIYGAVNGKQKLFGVPLYDKEQQITSCEEAKEIAEQIAGEIETAPVVRLASWDVNTVKGYGVGAFQPMGGKDALKELTEQLREQDIPVFLSEPFARVQKSGKGIRLKKDAIRSLANELSAQYSYFRSSNAADRNRPCYYLLEGAVVMERAKQLASSLDGYGFAGIAVEDLADTSYGNYRKGQVSSRDTTEKNFAQALSALTVDYPLMVNGGYYGGLKDVQFVYNGPDQGSSLDLADCEVPFYQMALSGLKHYAGEAVNRKENRRSALLLALETGSLIQYELAGDTSSLQGTELEQLYGADWNRNQELILQELSEFAPMISRISGVPVVKHEILAPHVARTWYENGWVVTVNKGDAPTEVAGEELEAWGYRMERSGEGWSGH